MNYKISTGILATTTVVFAIAFGISFSMLQRQPEMGPGFPGGDFPRSDSIGGNFDMPPFGEGEFPDGQFCECDDEEDDSTTEETDVESEETTEETDEVL